MSDVKYSIITPHYIQRTNQRVIDSSRQQLNAFSDIVRDPNSGIELVVIDNASEDEQSVGNLRFIATTYVRNRHNLGFGKAMNQGMKLAKGDYFLLLSNDVLFGDLSTLLEELHKTSFRFHSIAFPSFTNKNQVPVDGYFGGQWDGSCFMVPRTLVEEVGMYDEAFFAYYEDTDWFLRALKAGWNLMRSGKVLVHHLESVTSSHMEIRQKEFGKSREIFMAKNGEEGLEKVNYDYKRYPEMIV